MTDAELLQLAVEARQQAYAPYSNFAVGAALLTEPGEVVTGCNVENASYGLTLCAERAAVVGAISKGHRRFLRLALSVPGGGAPCGACRQVLHEFAPDLELLLGDESGTLVTRTTVSALLPDAFGPGHLQR